MTTIEAERRGYIMRHWYGELRLPPSFWINGALLDVAINVPLAMFLFTSHGARPPSVAFWATCWSLAAVTTLVAIWQLVGIWRSSYRYPGKRLWSRLARLAVIFSWASWLKTTSTLVLISGGAI